jgi:hypothetical protein
MVINGRQRMRRISIAATVAGLLVGAAAAATASPATVSAAAEPHSWKNGSIAPGSSTTFGFLGTDAGTTNPAPAPVSCSPPT